MERDIIARNLDVEHIMFASCQYGFHRFGKRNPDKLFCMLVTTDIHRCVKQLESAIAYLNYYDAIDCGICLGDIQGANFSESDGTWYTNIVNASKKGFYTVLGNHDLGNSVECKISATPRMAFDKFIRPVKDRIGIADLETPYYVKIFDKYKIALVVLNTYDMPDTLDERGNYKYHRGLELFSQKQIDWLIKTLQEIPSGYHVLVAVHDFRDRCKSIACDWTQVEAEIDNRYDSPAYGNVHILPSIIDAWINGTSLHAEYPAKKTGLPTLTVNCDFSARGKGEFVCYLCGHHHMDIMAVDAKFPAQHIISLASSAMDMWQNFECDLPREGGTKAEDLLTTISVHTQKRQIRLVRIGSNYTMDLKERTCITINY